ncbi:SusC/RagA family TonB-linked outer membrane protein [Saccharicrinis sp. FJH2]|uniref:SusC/RagA family TonB-linked outer membrane protein n=1 Tax=Saccharicrinis sp. FJH65 TaxID=3344659 RepID=UPI0035F4B5CF
MNKKTPFLLLCSLLFTAFNGYAINIEGIVSDLQQEPIPGVNIMVKGTSDGTVTDINGKYEITANDNDILVFSFIGFQTEEIPVNGSNQINVTLKTNQEVLDEFVVVGYGTLRKSTLTNSVSRVTAEDFQQGTVSDPIQLLRGKVAGLSINTTSGDPNNNGVQMMLRGVSTLSGNQEPLIVIDGIPGGSLSSVSQDDIESIDVLKDGSAAAIYGVRGTNGVILVNTKKGTSSGKNRIEYNGYFGTEQISNKIQVFSADEYRNLAETTGGVFTPVDNGYNTDWWNEVSQSPLNQTHNISLRGGDSHSNYYGSVTYTEKEGIIRNTDQNRFTTRVGFNHNMFEDKLRINMNLSNVNVKGNTVSTSDVLFGTLIANPTDAVFNPNTGEYQTFAGVANPVRLVDEFKEDIGWNEVFINGKITAEIIEGLNLNLVGGFKKFNHLNGSYATHSFDLDFTGQAWRNASTNTSKTLELFGNYSKKIGNHDFTALAGYSYQDYEGEGFNAYNYNFPNEYFGYNRMDLGLALSEGFASMGSSKSQTRLVSFFGRLNYSFKEKYLFAASLRAEGSSKFGTNNRWGYFPSVSAAWRLSEEGFMENITFLDDLKIKVGYGVTGTEPSSANLSKLRFTYGNPVFLDGQWTYTISPVANANPDLRWETKHELNAGVEFAFLKDKLSGEVNYYQRNTKDLIYSYNVPVPPNLAPTTVANVGAIKNSGVEVVLSGNVVNTRDFGLRLTGNMSYNTNILTKLSNNQYKRDFLELGNTGAPVQKNTHYLEEGDAIGNFYGWVSTGLDPNGEWMTEGEYGIDSLRQVMGNGIPKYFAGFSMAARYKNLDLSVELRGAFDYQILNQYRMLWENFIRGTQYNYPTSILDTYNGQYVNTAQAYVSYYIENGDYVKLDNVAIGYTFKFKKNVNSLRLYLSGQNLFTFTNYKGVDPEVNYNGLTPGIDYVGGYPTVRTYTLGLKLNL